MLPHLDRLGERITAHPRRDGARRESRAGAEGDRVEPRARHTERYVSDVGLRGRTATRHRSNHRTRETVTARYFLDHRGLPHQGDAVWGEGPRPYGSIERME